MARAFPRTEDAGIIEEEWIQINGQKVRGYGVHGSPALAVAHGVLELAERKPDCVSAASIMARIWEPCLHAAARWERH